MSKVKVRNWQWEKERKDRINNKTSTCCIWINSNTESLASRILNLIPILFFIWTVLKIILKLS